MCDDDVCNGPVDVDDRLIRAQKLAAFGRFACSVAHDVNNMLVVINGYSDLVARRVTDETLRADVGEIRRAGERAATLTRQVLAFCRDDEPRPHLVGLNDVVWGVESMVRVLVGQQVVLTTELDPALGSVLADHAELEQIVVNLAVNARSAMPDGGTLLIETANVRCAAEDLARDAETEPGRDYVRLRVRDSGIGMNNETRTRIFEPFYTTKPPGEGTGLGLAIVLRSVEQSGGHLVVTSEPGAGSTFDVFLPTAHMSHRSTTQVNARMIKA